MVVLCLPKFDPYPGMGGEFPDGPRTVLSIFRHSSNHPNMVLVVECITSRIYIDIYI